MIRYAKKKDFLYHQYKTIFVALVFLSFLLIIAGCGGGGGGSTSSGGSDTGVGSTGSPQISVNPSLSLNFGTVITVGNSSNLSVTVSNAGDTDLYISSVSSPSFPYSKQSDTCTGFTLAPATDACTISIQFAPAAETTYNSSFIIQSNGGNRTVNLSGTGQSGVGSPLLSVNPLSLNFGTVTVGNSSNLSVTVSNAGDTDLYISSVSSPSFPYSKQSDTCTGFTLAPATDACTISIQFAPAAETTYNSSFIIQSNGGNRTVNLSGTGQSASLPGTDVTLVWDAPTTNEDGTPLTDLAGYKVYYGLSSENYTYSVNNGNITGASISNLTTGTWCFAVTAYDTSGNESEYSDEVCTYI